MGGEETVSQTVAEAKTQIGKELYSGAVADLMTLTGAKYFSNKCSGETTCEDKKAKSYAEAHHIMGYIEPHLPEGYYEPRHEQARQEFLVKSKKHANLAGVDENKYVNEVNNEIKGLFHSHRTRILWRKKNQKTQKPKALNTGDSPPYPFLYGIAPRKPRFRVTSIFNRRHKKN